MTGPVAPYEPGPDEFESVQIMRLQPGDAIFVRVADSMTQQECDQLRLRIEHTFPGHRGLIIDGATEVGIIREDT